MSQRQLKTGYFIIEGLNSFSTVYYLFYLYFFMQEEFGFGNKANLALAALNGLIYMVGSFWAGRFAQRFGYFTSLKVGFATAMAGLTAGTFADSPAAQVAVMAVMVLGMCFTWPALEALVSENELPRGLQDMIGIYNIVWSATGALAYFIGGALLKNFGTRSLFWMPALIQMAQLAYTLWLERKAREAASVLQHCSVDYLTAKRTEVTEFVFRTPNLSRIFLKMAWLANPFAYLASNTLIAVMPGIARKLDLSTMAAGFCCSIWCFARLGSFWWFWKWAGWHYRFRWLLAAQIALTGTFGLLLLSPNLLLLIGAQIVFGCAIGLIYYSSLFYSMDRTENRGKHGGIHEAAIGLGNFAGPALGAAALHFLPQFTNSAAFAVGTVLMFGVAALAAIWRKGAGGND
jgi:predicted MFS family arabinose efflux permease